MTPDQLNVLITYRWQRLDDSLVQRIRDVSPRLNVIYPQTDAKDQQLLPSIDILYSIQLPKSIANAPRLKWIQLLSAGYDSLFGSEVQQSTIAVTNAAGIHGTPIAEFVLCSMIVMSRNLHRAMRTDNKQALWQMFAFMGHELYGATVGIIGLGAIGREVARLAHAFGMRVIGVTPHCDDPWTVPDSRYVPDELRVLPLQHDPRVEVRSPAELPWLLAESDYVVLTVPVTPQTRAFMGEAQFRMMKPTAYLINPSRGALIDDTALIKALNEKWIAGAALDVFQQEPLPADSPFYTMPNVLVTPHMAAHTDRLFERCVDVFCANLERFLSGQPLLNQVHPPRQVG
jgi:phosphoglycerate dehydrogenase-like enzyme